MKLTAPNNSLFMIMTALQHNMLQRGVSSTSGVPRGGFGEFNPPPRKILKALQNRAKLNPIVKIVKNCWI